MLAVFFGWTSTRVSIPQVISSSRDWRDALLSEISCEKPALASSTWLGSYEHKQNVSTLALDFDPKLIAQLGEELVYLKCFIFSTGIA